MSLRCPGRMGVGYESKGHVCDMSRILAAVTRQSCHPVRQGSLQVTKVGIQKEITSSVLSMLRDPETGAECTVLYGPRGGAL